MFDLKRLDDRRKELGMSFRALSQRSHVPVPTVQRILYGHERRLDLAKVSSIAAVLGLNVTVGETKKITPIATARKLRRQQAQKKAQQLVDMTQATSALEAQAVDEDILRKLLKQTTKELLDGPRLELWREL
jgi:transcriptional regulator with XRE-family HTH domain